MGKYVTVVGINEEEAKRDKDNIPIPGWFIEMEKMDKDDYVASLTLSVLEEKGKMSDAFIHADVRDLKSMMILFDYMTTDQEIDPYLFISRETGYAKSLIKESLEKYVKLGLVKFKS